VKFGTTEFHANRRVSGPQKREKIVKIANFNPLPDVGENP